MANLRYSRTCRLSHGLASVNRRIAALSALGGKRMIITEAMAASAETSQAEGFAVRLAEAMPYANPAGVDAAPWRATA